MHNERLPDAWFHVDMIKLPLLDRFKFLLERQFARGAGFQLLVVAALIGLISLIGGIAVRMAGNDLPFLDSVWWAFLRLTDPGYLGDDQGIWRRTVSTVLTVSGYVVFLGALVAIMTQWLIARMREFERGLAPVTLKNHVVIIGWTNRTLPLLRELIGNERSRRRFLDVCKTRKMKVVVLSEQGSALLGQALRADPLIGRASRALVLRYGSPLEEEAIHRAGCLNAAAVIMPGEFGRAGEMVSPDIQTIRALLSMDSRAARHGHPPPLVIAEIQDARRMETMRKAYRGPLEIVPTDDTISRMLVQNLLHPGLSAFYREVLTAREGNEFFLRPAGRLTGATLKEVAGQFPRAIVLGVIRGGGPAPLPMLNAPGSQRLGPQDQLVLLAREVSDTQPSTARGSLLAPIERPAARLATAANKTRHRILLLGWSQRVPSLFFELASYTGLACEVDLVSVADPAMRQREIERYSESCARVGVRHIEADFLIAGEMEKLELSNYSAIFLLSSDRLDSVEEADARAIVGHRIIEGLLEEHPLRPQILLELADAANEGLVRTPGAETLVSPLVISHMLAQVALQREVRLIFDELFTVGGAELDLRVPGPAFLGKAMSFQAMEAAVAARGETLLGFQRDRPGEAPQLLLNPPREQVFEVGDRDRLCILTTVS
ncbi:MAG: hypothetical protein RQ741_01440 [Wenzhouxiangellaceae bacterium]|nr:hypothetical protein [Wenzhouxiangellaceae bacterium]